MKPVLEKIIDLSSPGIVIDNVGLLNFKKIKAYADEIHKDKKNSNQSHDVLKEYHNNQKYMNAVSNLREDIKQIINAEVLRMVDMHETKYNYISRIFNFVTDIDLSSCNIIVERMWMNFQYKNEFLPLHNHSGLMSFVIWVNIPFSHSQEFLNNFHNDIIQDRSSFFQFVYTDCLGKISTLDLPVDRSWEGRMCVFPSELHHQVYPFYTSDEPRITISGNVRLSSNAV